MVPKCIISRHERVCSVDLGPSIYGGLVVIITAIAHLILTRHHSHSTFMNATASIQFFLNLLLNHLPIIIVSLVACVLIVTRWKQLGPASCWALSGFGLNLILGVAMPAVYMILNTGVLGHLNQTMTTRAYSIIAICSSVLYAIALVLLLLAILAGRSTSTSANPPAASPQ